MTKNNCISYNRLNKVSIVQMTNTMDATAAAGIREKTLFIDAWLYCGHSFHSVLPFSRNYIYVYFPSTLTFFLCAWLTMILKLFFIIMVKVGMFEKESVLHNSRSMSSQLNMGVVCLCRDCVVFAMKPCKGVWNIFFLQNTYKRIKTTIKEKRHCPKSTEGQWGFPFFLSFPHTGWWLGGTCWRLTINCVLHSLSDKYLLWVIKKKNKRRKTKQKEG